MAKRAREEGTTHKLLYFDFPGKAEAIRLALTHAGVVFEDHRFADRAEFQALKASGRLQFGQVPALEVTTAEGETTVLTQSAAILRYVAKLNAATNLYPADPLLAARVDAVCDLEAAGGEHHHAEGPESNPSKLGQLSSGHRHNHPRSAVNNTKTLKVLFR